jgi:UDP-glucose 4-epimerase
VLTLFLKRALDGEPLIVFGDGEQLRDFVFVDDVVAMHNACFAQSAASHEIFNVCSGQGTSINQLADLVVEVTGRRLRVLHEDVPEGAVSNYFARRRLPQELKTLVQSRDKAQRLVHWSPQTDLADGLAREWAWLQEHPQRWTVMSY